jgi:peptidoglycan/LPS O-acetylase OafA/YrhL
MHAFSTTEAFYAFHAERDPYIDAAVRTFGSIGPAGVGFFVISGFIILTVAMTSVQDSIHNSLQRLRGLFYFRRLLV